VNGACNMNAKNLLRLTMLGVSLTCIGLPVTAQVKPRPYSFVPLEPIAAQLSAPALDGPQTLDVSVASVYVPITPCRLLDTRFFPNGSGGTAPSPFGGGDTRGFWGWAGDGGTYEDFGGQAYIADDVSPCGIPSLATAIHVNITVVDPTATGFLRTWPNNTTEPGATIFAWNPGFGESNAATIAICSDGTESQKYDWPNGDGTTTRFADCPDSAEHNNPIDFLIKIYSTKPQNIVIDALGYYEPRNIP
jgi:hypothetical protein